MNSCLVTVLVGGTPLLSKYQRHQRHTGFKYIIKRNAAKQKEQQQKDTDWSLASFLLTLHFQ